MFLGARGGRPRASRSALVSDDRTPVATARIDATVIMNLVNCIVEDGKREEGRGVMKKLRTTGSDE